MHLRDVQDRNPTTIQLQTDVKRLQRDEKHTKYENFHFTHHQ